jgi:heme exporter protein B
MFQQIASLVSKDFTLEFRQRYSFFSLLLYVVSTIYIAYLILLTIPDARVWNALFWIILVFASINTAGKSFANESDSRFWYYYQIGHPRAIIISKIIYNTLLIWLISLVTYLLFSWFLGNPVQSQGQYILVVLLGSAAFSGILTVIAAIAVRTNNNATLMAILSIPLLLPVIIVVVKASMGAIFGFAIEENSLFFGALAGMWALVTALGLLLFPYLWSE